MSRAVVELEYASPSPPPAIDPRRRRGLIFLGTAVGAVGFAMTLQMGLNANYTAEELGMSGFQQGLLEMFRESCGIMALGVLALLAGFAEPLIGSAMLLLLAAGLTSYAYVPDFFWVIIASLVWSQGLHVWMPLPNSMALALAEPGRAGRRLGQISAAGAAGSGAGLVLALALHVTLGVKIRSLWLFAGAAALIAAMACLMIPRDMKTPGPRIVVRRKYWLYYLLCFLEGWRKQIFIAFAGFLLVKQHHTSLTTMLILWIAAQALGWLVSPQVGRLIDRFGERPILMFYYASMTAVFLGYAFVPYRGVLWVLFVADSVFFTSAMALTTYVNRIAPPVEHTPTLSLGVAMNHIAATTMPLVGGLLWSALGYRWAFLVGTTVAVISIAAAAMVPRRSAGQAHAEPQPQPESLGCIDNS